MTGEPGAGRPASVGPGGRRTTRTRGLLVWTALAAATLIPIAAATASPLLAWRDPVYVAAGFAGIVAMALLLLQPLLVGGYLPGLAGRRGRNAHRVVGGLLVAAVVLHVAGLWVTSPPDVVDVLLFRSPTPFSDWGAVAMWAVFVAALLAVLRGRLRLRHGTWRFGHATLAAITVLCGVVHALLIEGTMEPITKAGLSLLAIAATIKVAFDLRLWAPWRGRG